MDELHELYALLGVPPEATAEEIRRAYRLAARHLHPDVNVEPGATELFLRVQEAYRILSDPQARSKVEKASVPKPEEAKPEQDRQAADPEPPPVLRTIYSRSSLPSINEPQLVYALLELGAPPVNLPGTSAPPPLNLCLVLDRSASMLGERMDTIKDSAVELIRRLRPEDSLSIVVFSDRAEVLLSANDRRNRTAIETQIRLVRAGGGTEIYQGLNAGFSELQRRLNRKNINHLLLLTDGQTYGDEMECLRLAGQAALQGVTITCLGIGGEWNDVFLDRLASTTGGSCHYVSRASEIQNFLLEKFQGLGLVYADGLRLQLKLAAGVQLKDAFRLQPEPVPLARDFPLRLGCLYSRENLSILLEFVVSPFSSDAHQVGLADGAVELESLAHPGIPIRVPVRLERLVDHLGLPEQPPQVIAQAVSRITLYRMQDRARQELAEGNIPGATRRLQRLATRLLVEGDQDLARTVLLEVDRIQQTHLFSEEGEKRIKYGTRALLLPGRSS